MEQGYDKLKGSKKEQLEGRRKERIEKITSEGIQEPRSPQRSSLLLSVRYLAGLIL